MCKVDRISCLHCLDSLFDCADQVGYRLVGNRILEHPDACMVRFVVTMDIETVMIETRLI